MFLRLWRNLLFLTRSLTFPMAGKANYFEDKTDAEEAATVLAHFPKEAAKLVEGQKWIGVVTGKHERVSATEDRKTYMFISYLADPATALPGKAAELTVIVAVEQPPAGRLQSRVTHELRGLKEFPTIKQEDRQVQP
jgi:hypothetical protein